MGVDGTHGTQVFHWSPNSKFLDFAKVYCTKKSPTEVYLPRTT